MRNYLSVFDPFSYFYILRLIFHQLTGSTFTHHNLPFPTFRFPMPSHLKRAYRSQGVYWQPLTSTCISWLFSAIEVDIFQLMWHLSKRINKRWTRSAVSSVAHINHWLFYHIIIIHVFGFVYPFLTLATICSCFH